MCLSLTEYNQTIIQGMHPHPPPLRKHTPAWGEGLRISKSLCWGGILPSGGWELHNFEVKIKTV